MQPQLKVAMDNSFPKSSKLCGDMRIAELRKTGEHIVAWPMRVTYLPAEETKVLIWAPKRLFKHAVDRNRLRRLMREVYRLHQSELKPTLHIAFDYIDTDIQPFTTIEKGMVKAIAKLNGQSATP